MKANIYLLLITLITSVGSVCGQPVGTTFTDGVLNYRITNAERKIVEVARGSYSGDITVPSEVEFDDDSYKVESIAAFAFYRSQGMRSVILSEGLKTIGAYAFGLDSSLVSVTFNTTTLTTIGNDAFRACVALEKITIPEGVQRIGTGVFMGSWELGVVNIPSTLGTIGNNAFYGCPKVKSFNVENTNTKFKSVDGVLYDFALKTLIAYPNGSEETSFALPAGVKTLDTRMFMWAANLAEFTDHDHPDFSVIDGVLFDSEGETLIYCPPGKANEYKIPDGVKKISSGAFMGSKLAKIIIPESVEEIEMTTTFGFCTELAEFEVEASSTHFKSIGDGVLFTGDMTTLVAYPTAKSDEYYEIPNTVETISEHSFAHAISVKNIKLPDGLKSIEHSAFFLAKSLETIDLPNSITNLSASSIASCESLKNITLPDNMTSIPVTFLRYSTSLKSIVIPQDVESIGNHAFQYSGLESVSLPDGLITIGTRAFDATQLTSVVIPEKVTSIGVGAFVDNANLKEVTFLSDTPPAIGADAFYGIDEDAYLIVPAGKKDDYETWAENNSLPFTADNIYEAISVVVDPATGLKFVEVATGKVLDKLPQMLTGKDYIILPEDEKKYKVTDVRINGETAEKNTNGEFYVTLDENKNIKVKITTKEVVVSTKHTVTIRHIADVTVSKVLYSYVVENGDDFSFMAEVKAKDAISTLIVYVNGEELAPESDGYYLIAGITEDLLITFSLTTGNRPTANEHLSTAKISTSAGAITIEAPQKVAVQIVSLTGQLVYSSEVVSTTVNLPSGIYAVIADGITTKVVVK